jgi:hypothetical protein
LKSIWCSVKVHQTRLRSPLAQTTSRNDLEMGQRRETAVTVRRIHRQQMHATDRVAQAAFEKPGEIGQIDTDPVRVANQLDLVLERHRDPFG